MHHPYTQKIINQIETVSLIVGLITVYAGMWYLTGDIGDETSIIIFAIILLTNLLFLTLWITAFLRAVPLAEKVS